MRSVLAGILLVACAADEPRLPAKPCVVQHWIGSDPEGELGIRFGSPLDVNGDDIADIAIGAAFADLGSTEDAGIVYAWSGASGALLLEWEGTADGALFGHSVVLVPDLDGDGLADIVASEPNRAEGGRIVARSPASGRLLWSATSGGNLGWGLALAGDQDGDGVDDLFASEPSAERGRVVLLDGHDGEVLRTYDGPSSSFGLYVTAVADHDDDRLGDVFVGAPFHESSGAAFLISSRTGATLRTFLGEETDARFGDTLTGVADVDGDGVDDLAVGAPYTSAAGQVGQVYVFSSRTGALLHHIIDSNPGANYGRMVGRVHDVDLDGADDIAIGAPWKRVNGIERAGYFEVRSGRTLEVIASVAGSRENAWLGWHIAPAERMIDGTHRGILVSSILSEENGVPGAGRIELYEVPAP